jgi:hypothetical protein
MRVLSGRILGGDDPLVGGDVSQRLRLDDVADRPDPGRLGAHETVDLDEPAVELDAQRLEPEILGERPPSDRDEEHLGFELDGFPVLRAVTRTLSFSRTTFSTFVPCARRGPAA